MTTNRFGRSSVRRWEKDRNGRSSELEAAQKAHELQANLILLDIGLPTLNGIDAARRIRKVAPKSKILFVSQESSSDVVEEALALGALRYVVKIHAGSDLLAAVEAISRAGSLSVPDCWVTFPPR
jgi:DNA-binding NarL/FixJ family response regulator